MPQNKTDIWTPIISAVAIILIGFMITNIVTNYGVKDKLKESTKREIILLKEIAKIDSKIDSLEVEINKRDSVINKEKFYNFTLTQFKEKYEKNRNNIITTMSIDSNIKFFTEQVGN